MAAVAWTAIGLLGATLAALVGAIFQLGGRIDGLGRELGGRIDGLSERIDTVSRDLGARMDALSRDLGDRIDGVSERIDAHVERHAG